MELRVHRNDVDWPACLHVTTRDQDVKSPGFLPAIVDIWSGVLDPPQGRLESGHQVERRFTSLTERAVSLLEDSGDSIARHLWDGSQALAQYIDQTIALQTPFLTLPLLERTLSAAIYRRLHLLELGCGCGSVGISIAQTITDCDALLTDLPEAAELVELNIARMAPAIASRARFAPLDWEQPLPPDLAKRSNDLIIVSECTYNSDTLRPLVKTLVALLRRSPRAVILVATKTRHSSERVFFDLMAAADLVEQSTLRVPLPGIPGNGYADSATDVGLHVFRGRLRRPSVGPRERSGDHDEKT